MVDICGRSDQPTMAVAAHRAHLCRVTWGIAASGFVAERLRGVRLSHENLAEDLFADTAYRAHLAEVCAGKAVALASGPAPGVRVLSHGSL